MRMSQLVAAPNWRYAVGEVFLIVVGVTIALAGTSWYEGRQERRDESLVLQQLRQTLSEDLQYINDQWEITRQRERNIMVLLEHLESDRPYTPELARYFQSLLGWRTVSIRTAPFEALKVQGYKPISSTMLRPPDRTMSKTRTCRRRRRKTPCSSFSASPAPSGNGGSTPTMAFRSWTTTSIHSTESGMPCVKT